jgi:hypothetical protein
MIKLMMKFLLLTLAFLFSACGATRTDETTGKVATEPRTAQFLVKKLQSRHLDDVERMSAQTRIFVEGDGQSMSANANIVWVRDSAIWLNVKKFGLEAARVLVTPDSVFMINRLSKTWYSKSLESLQAEYQLPAGFDLLQDFLLGRAWIDGDIEMTSDIDEGLHRLAGSNGVTAADYRLEEGSFLLRRETFLQPRTARNISFSFDNYQKIKHAGLYPLLRTIRAFSPETKDVQFELEFLHVDFNTPAPYRFEIPATYQRAE